MRCDCVQHPKLRQNGWSDPPHAGWVCPVCKKKYHQYVLSNAYKKQVKNMAASWSESVKKDYEKAFD